MNLVIEPHLVVSDMYDYDDDQCGYEDEESEEIEPFIGPAHATDWLIRLDGEVVARIHRGWTFVEPGENGTNYHTTLCDPFKTPLYDGDWYPRNFSRAMELIREFVDRFTDPYSELPSHQA